MRALDSHLVAIQRPTAVCVDLGEDLSGRELSPAARLFCHLLELLIACVDGLVRRLVCVWHVCDREQVRSQERVTPRAARAQIPQEPRVHSRHMHGNSESGETVATSYHISLPPVGKFFNAYGAVAVGVKLVEQLVQTLSTEQVAQRSAHHG